MVQPEAQAWARRAVLLSKVSIAVTLAIGIVSLVFGGMDESWSVLAHGVESLVDCAIAALIIWRFRERMTETELAVSCRYQNIFCFHVVMRWGS